MRKLHQNLIADDIRSDLYDEARKQQEAYALLQRGLKRHQLEGALLSGSALKKILLHRNKLVLSTQERCLLDDSERRYQQEKSRRLRVALFISSFLLLAAVLSATFRPWEQPELTFQAVQQQRKTMLQENKILPPTVTKKQREKPVAESEAAPEMITTITPETESPPVRQAAEKTPAPEKSEKDNPFSMTIPVSTFRGKVLRVRKFGKWGLADTDYNVLLPLKYRRVRVLHEQHGYFILEKGAKRGVANSKGTVIVPPVLDALGSYFESWHLLVVHQNGQSGVYNLKNNKKVIPLEYKEVAYFSDGVFGVQNQEGKWGFMDAGGNLIIPMEYDAIVHPFKKGRAYVKQDGEAFFIDRSGEVLASLD